MTRKLQVADIYEVWPQLWALAPPRVDGHNVSADYVAQQIRTGRALCLASADAIVLLTLELNRLHQDTDLVVWSAASTGPHGAVERYRDELFDVARELGAKRIVCHTQRPGWARRLGGNWKLREATFECEVGEREQQEVGPNS